VWEGEKKIRKSSREAVAGKAGVLKDKGLIEVRELFERGQSREGIAQRKGRHQNLDAAGNSGKSSETKTVRIVVRVRSKGSPAYRKKVRENQQRKKGGSVSKVNKQKSNTEGGKTETMVGGPDENQTKKRGRSIHVEWGREPQTVSPEERDKRK